MKEYKNIDELFKEVASGFEPEVSEKVWDGIEEGFLNSLPSKRRNYSRWTIAAVLLLLITSGSIWYFTGVESPKSSSNEINTNSIVETKINIEADVINNETEEVVEELAIEDNASNINDFKETIQLQPAQTNNDEIIEAPSLLVEYESTEIQNESLSQNIEQLSSRSIYDIAFMDANYIDKTITVEEYIKKRKKLHTYTGIGIKPAMAYYPNTQDQFTYTAEADFGIILNRFYIETGVGYQHMKERGVYQYNYKSNDSIGVYNRVVSFEIDPSNPDNITYKTAETIVYDSIDHFNVQSPLFNYSYLNIPLKVGYKIWNKDKLSLGVETGLLFSKLLKSEIPQANFNFPEYTLLSIEDNTPERVDMNMQLLLAVRFNYRFTRAMSLSLQPEFTKYLNSIYNTEIGDPNIKPYTMGLKFGIYYDF